MRITKTARFYYRELYVLEEFPPAPDFSRVERKLVRELQRQENRSPHPRYPLIVPVIAQHEISTEVWRSFAQYQTLQISICLLKKLHTKRLHIYKWTEMMGTEKPGYREYKCPNCGWVHAARPIAAITEATVRYLRCFRCGEFSSGFVPAAEGDAPLGSTMQCIYVPGA